MPSNVFAFWRGFAEAQEQPGGAGVEHATLLALADEEIPDHPPNEATVFFQMLNTRPEARYQMDITHLAATRNTMVLQQFLCVSSRPFASEYVLVRHRGVVSVDLPPYPARPFLIPPGNRSMFSFLRIRFSAF